MPDTYPASLAIASLSHHHADVAALESFRFPDEEAFLARAREFFRGVCLLQTCNRVEVMVDGDAEMLRAFLTEQGRDGFAISEGLDAVRHLFELASGLDSMIVGEDQIIGQLRKSLAHSQKAGACSRRIELCLTKAVHVGIQVRMRTDINKGAVSIGSAAVELAESMLGSLKDRHILVIGSGEMGQLVAQALAAKDLTAIYVASRTYRRAEALAGKIGGTAVDFSDLYHYLSLSDVVISCTSAPHPIIHPEKMNEVMEVRRWPLEEHPHPLIIIDIAQPRDVEESVGTIDGVHLYTIDDLRTVSSNNLSNRRSEADRAVAYIEDEITHLDSLLRRSAADDTLAALYTWAEMIRIRERDRALNRLGPDCNEKTTEVIDDLTRVILRKLLSDLTVSIRSSAECGDVSTAESVLRAITQGERLCFHREE